MTLALADQSSLPNLGPTWLWVILAAIALAALAKCIVDQITNAPTQDADVSHLDALDGVGRCDQRTCPGPGMFNVTDDAGHTRRVCGACFELGWRLGWWVSFANRQPYDQEAAS